MSTSEKSTEPTKTQVDEVVISNPETILQVMHDKKQLIFSKLFDTALTIQELNSLTKLNPGTIKRHLDQLIGFKLVYVEYTKRNEYNILMKYYRTTAKKFRINMVLPDDIL